MVPSEELQSKPKIPRTPQTNDFGYVEPGEFGQKYNENSQEEQTEEQKLRYHKPVDPEYQKAFSMRPRLARTPNAEPGYGDESEFAQG